jgi:tRNA (guanine37-N1)-methyltransferase
VFEGAAVPAVLLSGHHRNIERWRRESSLLRTFVNRPDLLRKRALTAEETEILQRWQAEVSALLGGPPEAPNS